MNTKNEVLKPTESSRTEEINALLVSCSAFLVSGLNVLPQLPVPEQRITSQREVLNRREILKRFLYA